MTPVEFRVGLWHQKTRVPGLSCGACFCDPTFFRFSRTPACDRHGHRQTQTQTQAHGLYRRCITSRGKKTLLFVDVLKTPSPYKHLSTFDMTAPSMWTSCMDNSLYEWLGSRVVSVPYSGADGPGFKSQSRCCRVTVLDKLFTPIVPLFTKLRNW